MNKVFVVTDGGCPGVGCCEEIVGVYDTETLMLKDYPGYTNYPYYGNYEHLGGRLEKPGECFTYTVVERNRRAY